MKSTDFITEAPVQYSTTFQGAPESHPMYNTYYQQELAKRKNLPSGEETAKIMAANRVKTDMAKAGATAFPVAPTMTGSKTDPRNPPGNGPTIPQPAPAATSTVPDETDDMRGGQSQNAALPAGGFKAAAQPTAPAAQPSPTGSAAVGADPMQPTAAPAASTPAAPAQTPTSTARKGSWQDIYNMNKAVIGANPNLIKPGQQLKMPDGSTYTVKSGDTLSKIAGGNTASAVSAPTATNTAAADPRQGRSYGTDRTAQASATAAPAASPQAAAPAAQTSSSPVAPANAGSTKRNPEVAQILAQAKALKKESLTNTKRTLSEEMRGYLNVISEAPPRTNPPSTLAGIAQQFPGGGAPATNVPTGPARASSTGGTLSQTQTGAVHRAPTSISSTSPAPTATNVGISAGTRPGSAPAPAPSASSGLMGRAGQLAKGLGRLALTGVKALGWVGAAISLGAIVYDLAKDYAASGAPDAAQVSDLGNKLAKYLNNKEALEALSPEDRKDIEEAIRIFTERTGKPPQAK